MLGESETRQRQHDGHREDEIAREIRQFRGQADAEVVDQGLNAGNCCNEEDLIAKPFAHGRIDIDRRKPGSDRAGEKAPGAHVDRAQHRDSPSRLSHAVSHPVKRVPRMELQ